VENIVEHGSRITVEWVAIAAAAWTVSEQPVTLFRLLIGNLGRKRRAGAGLCYHGELARIAVAATTEAPWLLFLAVALHRETAIGQISEFAYRADTAAPFAGRHH